MPQIAGQLKRLAAPAVSCLVAFALGGMPLIGQPSSVIIPNNMAAQDAVFGSWTLMVSNVHIQEIYGSRHFSDQPMVITELRFRPNAAFGQAFTTLVANVQINLSTTSRMPDYLDPTFANNVGPDDTKVFSGPIAISSHFSGPSEGPKDFDIAVPLATPFLYYPAAGNLLVEIRNFSGSAASYLSGQSLFGDGASKLYGPVGAATGWAQSGVDTLKVIYLPTNAPSPALRLLRGPYLQAGGCSNMIVRWRSRPPSDGRVLFGPSTNDLRWQVTDSAVTAEHSITLGNLAPDTKYFYSVGSTSTNVASGQEFFFLTAPLTAKPTRIWALGDCGTITQEDGSGQTQVRDAYYAFAKNRAADLWLMLGDNAYYDGLDDEYQMAVFEMYAQVLPNTPLWTTIGNHDAVSGDYFNIFSLPMRAEAGGMASGTKAYYSFDYGNIHFLCLDSETSSRANGSPMLIWLAQDLAANTRDWTIAFWHQPPYSKGSHDSDTDPTMTEMRENVVPILENFGVDLVLCGHSHNYERSCLLNGHYGHSASLRPEMLLDGGSGRVGESGPYLKSLSTPEGNGTVYVVAGSSGWADVSPLNHPAMFSDRGWGGTRGLNRLGSLVIDVDGNRLDAQFLRETGTVDDHFTIIKGTGPAPFRLVRIEIVGGIVRAQWKSRPGHSYQLEMANGLENPAWTPMSPTVTASGATTEWSGSIPTGTARRFFRVSERE